MILKEMTSETWRTVIRNQVDSTVLHKLDRFLTHELASGKTLYPPREQWFRALDLLDPEQVKVVILGQDPYHGPAQAQGLSFSVPEGMKLPPSLRNIFKEQSSDLSIENDSGDLTGWAEQGVLLLNAVLTVEAGRAGSHSGQGWEVITDAVIDHLNQSRPNIVFMLWGGYAQKKAQRIDDQRHCILTAAHPSPLSAHRGWFGCGHFSKANAYLHAHGLAVIDWRTSGSDQLNLL